MNTQQRATVETLRKHALSSNDLIAHARTR